MAIQKTTISQILCDEVYNGKSYSCIDSFLPYRATLSESQILLSNRQELYVAGIKLEQSQFTTSKRGITINADIMNKFINQPVNITLVEKGTLTKKGHTLTVWVKPTFSIFDYTVHLTT